MLPNSTAWPTPAKRPAPELMMLPVNFRDDLMPERAIVQIKWDGIHSGFRPDRPLAFTREGNPMECTSHLRSGLASVCATLRGLFGTEHLLFGEYEHADGFDATLADFKRGKGTGIIQLFDAVPVDVWEGRAPSPSLSVRLHRLQRAHAAGTHPASGVGLCKSTLFTGEARENIVAMMPELWAQGLEGIVVKDADSPYVRDRSPHWLRIKRQNTVDLPIRTVDAPGGRLKALVVAYGAKDVRVGVGFSDAQRANPSMFRHGMIVELSHLGRTASGSLRSPSFNRIRTDKES